MKEIIAHNIVTLRKEAGMTQLQLAEKLNYSDKAISKWERGDSIPDVTVLKDIADLFDVTVDYLLKEDHSDVALSKRAYSQRQSRNQKVMAAIAAGSVWFIATILYISLLLKNVDTFDPLAILIYAIPISAVVFLVFSIIWEQKALVFISLSVVLWGTIASVYFTYLTYTWQLWLLGIPGQLIIYLASRIQPKPKDEK